MWDRSETNAFTLHLTSVPEEQKQLCSVQWCTIQPSTHCLVLSLQALVHRRDPSQRQSQLPPSHSTQCEVSVLSLCARQPLQRGKWCVEEHCCHSRHTPGCRQWWDRWWPPLGEGTRWGGNWWASICLALSSLDVEEQQGLVWTEYSERITILNSTQASYSDGMHVGIISCPRLAVPAEIWERMNNGHRMICFMEGLLQVHRFAICAGSVNQWESGSANSTLDTALRSDWDALYYLFTLHFSKDPEIARIVPAWHWESDLQVKKIKHSLSGTVWTSTGSQKGPLPAAFTAATFT